MVVSETGTIMSSVPLKRSSGVVRSLAVFALDMASHAELSVLPIERYMRLA